MGALQWLHCCSEVGLYSLLSVLLQFLHLYRIFLSAFIAIEPATYRAFFNLSYADLADLHILTKFSKDVRAELCIIDLWMELEAESVQILVLHCLDLA